MFLSLSSSSPSSKTLENYGVFYLPNGDKFVKSKGYFGTLIKKDGKVYVGEFVNGKLDGWGTQRVSDPNGDGYLNEYIGTFKRGCKDGEGQMYYANDEVYDGTFKKNKRCGQGIMWFSDGALYLGEWRNDKFNGHGILVQANGNRFEGSFSNGKKHGEGIYYHKNSGQVQKGIWIDDLCKCSVMQDDEIREKPKSYSIPELKLQNPEFVVAENFKHVLCTAASKI